MEDELLNLYNQNLADEASDLYDQRQRDLVNQAAMNVFSTGFNNRNQGIMSQAQPFEFLSSAYEDENEDAEQVDYLPGQEQPSGIAKLLDYIPFVGEKSLGRAIIDMLPEMSPEAKNIRNFYGSQFGLTPTGQVASGIMKGYNPVSGSDLLNKRFGFPAKQIGLAPAIRRRIDRIANRKIAQTDTSRARIKELQDLARADTISRARFDNPNVYASADRQGFTNDRGGFDTSAADRAGTSAGSGRFSPSTSRGRSGY
jgi:hypothetical protein